MYNQTNHGPVVIGALGGSGTRVVAEILQEMGLYLGSDLNHALDNLWFTFLFKRPYWHARAMNGNPALLAEGTDIFYRKMTGAGLQTGDYFSIIKAAVGIALFGPKNSRGLWLAGRVASLVNPRRPNLADYKGWGWKEPNAHIYLDHLSRYFHEMKYIHVIRHGLDMAYSSNQQQLFNWGSLFDVEPPRTKESLPQAALTYWIKANRRAVDLGRKLLRERFLVLNFDNLCRHPQKEIGSMIDFLDMKDMYGELDRLSRLPKLPVSSGRYKKHGPAVFDEKDVEAVKEFGFSV